MLALGLALAASVAWGAADFLGGLKSRPLPLLVVIGGSQLVGLILVAALTLGRGSFPNGHTAAWAALGGIAGVVGVAAFYRGMAIGTISVIAPVSATGAAIPLAVGLARGERPTLYALAGIALAMVGVVLASAEPNPGGRPGISRGIPLAFAAAVGFGLFFLALSRASAHNHALEAAFAMRLSSVPLLIAAIAVTRPTLRLPPIEAGWIVLLGVLDAGANVVYALAAARGLMSLVSVVGSLYPVTTVMLAQALLREHVSTHQRLGIALAIAGVALIAV
ncbi:MAG: EamA family transporter [Gaiellaceae bacterium]